MLYLKHTHYLEIMCIGRLPMNFFTGPQKTQIFVLKEGMGSNTD